ncbi:hypothetical protein A2Y85_01180 [candidate division WOR-3 bacterium RBG_13_43_14]|uniref:4Fe-4S ferredoxin-type domain-containing protein n=1 Tax=candidate division WOR-3 bacterium RBG_13_43_14 TaxID=1802590 RepID=A0A1F4UFU7_UNCW3|nr:MAG: hypothetical protein A2Y85_01180 [candidate division WOR-3 bacterium RBG_13_43_14]
MHFDIYEHLAGLLDQLPNGFPRTESRVEIRLLKKIFSPEEANVAVNLTGKMEPLDKIAERLNMEIKDTRTILISMASKLMVLFDKIDGKMHFRLAPFIVGIYEGQLDYMDKELAELFEQYMNEGGAAGIMKPRPALQRVVPAMNTVKTEWIMSYDNVHKLLELAKVFGVRDCICRVQQDKLGKRRCDHTIKACVYFSDSERPPRPEDITKAEAIAILDAAEKEGLVHSVSNVANGVFYFCNCCGCCCGILRGITDYGIEKSVAAANYYAIIDQDKCTSCALCLERCQINAITDETGLFVVSRNKCIGCGLCVGGCPSEAVSLNLRPESEIIHPPEDFDEWERKRAENRQGVK